jgi:anti-anti-sigma regulatory factor
MKLKVDTDTVRVSDLRDLNEDQAGELAADIGAAVSGGARIVEFDLSQFRAIDCGAVDCLLAIRDNVARVGDVVWRLVNPPPDLRQLLELVRLHRVFEITPPRIPEMSVL